MIGHGLGEVGFAALSLALALNLSPLAVSIPLVIIASFIIMVISQKKGESGDITIALVSTCALTFGVIITAITTTKMVICLENFSTLIVSGDFSSSVSLILLAILPISVDKPIETTIAFALPVTTLVPEKRILF